MAALRRSTRLSIQKQDSPKLDTNRQYTQIWLRVRNKNVIIITSSEESSDNESDCEKVSKKLNRKKQTNNENDNVLNTMNSNTNCATNAEPKRSTIVRTVEQVTPRSSMRKLMKRESKILDTSSETEEINQLNASPPKQVRVQEKDTDKTVETITSPSRLLNSLSIKETPKKLAATPRNKYQNARRVLNSTETKNLPGREEQLEKLSKFLNEHLEEQRSGSLYISGQPGTGKTACLSLLLKEPHFAGRLQCVYINCTSIATVGSVYKKLSDELHLKPTGRTERDFLNAIHEHLRKSKRMLLLVLDEIDQLCSSRQEVLYTIFEWPAIPQARLLLIGIANSLDLTDRALLRLKAHCALQPELMHFPPYTKQQIVKIFESRLAEADVLNIFPPVTLQLLAAKVSAVSGDVRRALDIGRRVVEMAEQQRNSSTKNFDINAIDGLNNKEENVQYQPVQVTQVASVLGNVYGTSQTLEKDLDESFPLQQKIMLCSLMLMLKYKKHKDISIMRLHEVYRRVCQKRNINALDQTEFSGLVDLVETRGIVRIMRKKEPRLARILLQWNEEEVNGALQDKQLIASILADRNCLESTR